MMLQKNKSQRIKLIKYGLSAPLFILMLVLSSATIGNSTAINNLHDKAELVLERPAANVLNNAAAYNANTSDVVITDSAISTDTVPNKKSKPKYIVNVMPSFPGGQSALDEFLAKNIKYPAEAKNKNIRGRSVITFIVQADGSLSDFKVARAAGGGTDEEAIRVLKASPNWKPATENGSPVSSQVSIPVNFSLDGTSAKVVSQKQLNDQPVFTAVEQIPTFPGGDEAFTKFLAINTKYPKAARDAGLQGRVIASFIIEKDGSLSNIKIVRGVGMGIDEEAERVLRLSPNWKPGLQNGHTVRVQYAVPISFALADEDNKGSKTGYVPNKNLYDTSHVSPLNKIRNGYGTDPLYVLDGKIIKKEQMSILNPGDIQSLSVLKDKESTAIYGKDGEHGVILIKTKKSLNRFIK